METVLGILRLVLAPVFTFFNSKYFLRPNVTIELVRDKQTPFITSKMRIPDPNFKNRYLYLDPDSPDNMFEVSWRFNLVLRNNSEITAFYPRIEVIQGKQKLTHIDPLNELQPIKAAENAILKAQYTIIEKKAPIERSRIGTPPPAEFTDIEILLSYENSKKIRFYTLFTYDSTNKNVFLRNRPKEYKQYLKQDTLRRSIIRH